MFGVGKVGKSCMIVQVKIYSTDNKMESGHHHSTSGLIKIT